MKKKILYIALYALSILGTYAVATIICDFAAASEEGRIIPIYSVETDKKTVALTFDAAWGNEDTDAIIDILKEYEAPSTFFVTGDWAKRFPEDVKKLYSAGHDIANHSDSHPHIENMSYEELKADTLACNERIKKITGAYPLLYRGPYGEYNNTLIEMLHSINMYYIQWDVDSLDWKNPSPERMERNVTERVKNGSIVLLHNGAKNTAKALPSILNALKNDGYEFVLVKDLIYKEKYITDITGRQHIK